MGQTTSASRTHDEFLKSHDVSIYYTSMGAGNKGFPMVDKIRSSDLGNITKLRLLADNLKKYAKTQDIAVLVELSLDFVPSGNLAVALKNTELKNLFAGIHIDGIKFRGEFHANVSDVDKVEWWDQVQQLITYLGFDFRKYAEIEVEFMFDMHFTRNSRLIYAERAININNLVFEKAADDDE